MNTIDPVHQHTEENTECQPVDGKWYFFDETWSNDEGPFASREEAMAALEEYAKTL